MITPCFKREKPGRSLLDTNVCIQYLNGKSEKIKAKVEMFGDMISLCSVVKAELFYGAARSNNPERTKGEQLKFVAQFRSFPFDDQVADIYGKILLITTCLDWCDLVQG